MAFYGGKDLSSLLLRERIILDEEGLLIYDSKRVKQAAYELSLGGEVYRTDNEDESCEYLDKNNRNITINPGQFSLLLTEEVVNIPKDKLAFISIKASEKLKGLINVSGFHVDPGYQGKLLFSVYNASPSKITLQYKEPYFLIWFTDLRSKLDDKGAYNGRSEHYNQLTIKPKYIDALKNGEMVSPHVINKKIDKLIQRVDKDKQKHVLEIKRILWGLSIGIAGIISFNIAYWSKENEFTKGYQKRQVELEYNDLFKKINNIRNDSLSLHLIDSLIDLRLKNGYVKK